MSQTKPINTAQLGCEDRQRTSFLFNDTYVSKQNNVKRALHVSCGGHSGKIVGNTETREHHKKIWLRCHSSVVTQKKAIVIGAGLAGCSTAYALAKRGWTVSIVDQSGSPAAGASGNLQGALYMRLSGTHIPLSDLLVTGYAYSANLLKTLLLEDYGKSWALSGLVQAGFDERELLRQRKIIAQGFPSSFVGQKLSSELSQLSGLTIEQDGLWFEQGGWVHPPALCQAMLRSSGITFHGGKTVSHLEREKMNWKVTCSNGWSLLAPVVVVANSYSAATLAQTSHLPLKVIRGQLSYVPATEKSCLLKAVLCGKRYVTPAFNGLHTVGATHQFNDMDTTVREEDHHLNLMELKKGFPTVYDALGGDGLALSDLKGRVGFRCSTPDYLPIIGPVVDKTVFNREFALLANDAKTTFSNPPTYLSGLYVNVGHGSRGLITCPLSGELIARQIENEALPVSLAVAEALHPSRFLARALIRSKS